MRPIKAFLFVVYCTAAVAVLSVMFSQVWRSSRLVSQETSFLSMKHPHATTETASLPLAPINQSQS
jgi:hypothetical protein